MHNGTTCLPPGIAFANVYEEIDVRVFVCETSPNIQFMCTSRGDDIAGNSIQLRRGKSFSPVLSVHIM